MPSSKIPQHLGRTAKPRNMVGRKWNTQPGKVRQQRSMSVGKTFKDLGYYEVRTAASGHCLDSGLQIQRASRTDHELNQIGMALGEILSGLKLGNPRVGECVNEQATHIRLVESP